MGNWARTGYVIAAWLFVLSIIVQVFLVGLALFESSGYWKTHIDFGYTGVHGTALLTILLAFLGRLPRARLGRTALPVVLSFILPAFTFLRRELPAIAALHAVGAVFLFWLALAIAGEARALVPPPLGTAMSAEPIAPRKEG